MWQSFRDSFDAAVHNCPSLTKIQKFNYLRAELHGDASRTIAGLSLTDTNYDHTIDLLTKKYGQPHKIIQAHIQTLLEISSPTNSLTSLQLFYDTIESHMRGLTALGKKEDSYEYRLYMGNCQLIFVEVLPENMEVLSGPLGDSRMQSLKK